MKDQESARLTVQLAERCEQVRRPVHAELPRTHVDTYEGTVSALADAGRAFSHCAMRAQHPGIAKHYEDGQVARSSTTGLRREALRSLRIAERRASSLLNAVEDADYQQAAEGIHAMRHAIVRVRQHIETALADSPAQDRRRRRLPV